MKYIGQWAVPENETFPTILEMIEKNTFTCVEPIDRALKYVSHFGKAIDVGAWIGDSVKHLSESFDFVYAFEANRIVYDCCSENIKNLKINNVKLENYALSDTTEEKLLLNGPTTFSGWVDTKGNARDIEPTRVSAKKLDSFDFENIDFIKIDVDSHEGYLLQGSIDFFKKNNPVVLIEHKERIIYKRQNKLMPNPIQFLESIGYKKVENASEIDIVFVRD